MRSSRLALAGALVASAFVTAPSLAQTQFSLDASAPGEADPDKGIDYIGSVLAFNVYDALLVPGQNGQPIASHVAASWTIDGDDYVYCHLEHPLVAMSLRLLRAELPALRRAPREAQRRAQRDRGRKLCARRPAASAQRGA